MNDSLQIGENEKNKKDKKIFIGVFILIVLAIVGVLTYVAMMATPKKVFTTSIDQVFKTINKNSKEEIKTINGEMGLQIEVNTKEDNEILDMIKDINLKLNYGFDYENKKMNIGLDTTYQNKDLIKASLYTKEENAYVYLDKVYDKYIQVPMEGVTEIFNNQNNVKDYQTILNEVKKALNNSLKDKYFSSENTKISIKGKDINVTKNILNLNEENQKSLYKDITNYLNNETFINSVANITQEDKDSIKESLENEEFDVIDDFTISIYTKKMTKEFVGIEIKDSSSTLSVFKEDKETYTYSFVNEEKIDGTIKIQENNNHYTITFMCNVDDANIKLQFDTSYKYNEEIKDIDTTNSVLYENITEEEQEKILNNFLELEGIQLLTETFNNLINSTYNTAF